jgi:hypothetical protein
METSKYVLSEGTYVIKRVKNDEIYKSPKKSIYFRKQLLAPIVEADIDMSGNPKPPEGLVRSKSVYTRIIKGSSKPKYLMRTTSKISCGQQCVDGAMTWISDNDLEDYVETMPIASVGRVITPIELFNMVDSIHTSIITPNIIECIHRIISQSGKNLIPYNNCEIMNIFRNILRGKGLTSASNEAHEFDMLISMAFGSSRLSLADQIDVLSEYKSYMIDYVKKEMDLQTNFQAEAQLYETPGHALWNDHWDTFTAKFGFSVADNNVTPYKLIDDWITSVEGLRGDHSQRCSIYSYDLMIILILCIISEGSNLNMHGYYYNPRNLSRLKDEQLEFCLDAYAIEHMIQWSEPFTSDRLIDSLETEFNSHPAGQVGKGMSRKKKKRKKKTTRISKKPARKNVGIQYKTSKKSKKYKSKQSKSKQSKKKSHK